MADFAHNVRILREVERDGALRAVKGLANWSEWRSFNEVAVSAPRTPGVYLFRLPATHEVVYVGMAGERGGSGAPKGLYGRLSIYRHGRGAVSGFGEAALDRALAETHFVQTKLTELEAECPKRAKVWAQDAISWIAPEICWAECQTGIDARRLESEIETLLGPFDLWNRSSEKARRRAEPGVAEPDDDSTTGHTFVMHGFTIDLDLLYRAMFHHSEIVAGERIFNGRHKGVPAVKRLISALFGVPVRDNIHPVNNAIRSECRDRLRELGWAFKEPGRSAKYVLHRELSHSALS